MTKTFDFKAFIDEGIASRPIEARIVRKVVRALKAAGNPVVKVDDGEEHIAVTTERDVLDQAFNLDELHLYTANGGWVFLVMGNEWDVICDYSISLEDALQPVNDYIDKNN